MKSAPGRKRDPWLGRNHPGDPYVLVIAPTLKGGEFAPVRVKALFARCKNCGRLMPCRAAAWSWHRGDRTDTVCTRCYGAPSSITVDKGHPLYDSLKRLSGDAGPPSVPD